MGQHKLKAQQTWSSVIDQVLLNRELLTSQPVAIRRQLVFALLESGPKIPSTVHYRALLGHCLEILGAAVEMENCNSENRDEYVFSRLAIVSVGQPTGGDIDWLFQRLIITLHNCDYLSAARAAVALSASKRRLSACRSDIIRKAVGWLTSVSSALNDEELARECCHIARFQT